MILQILDIYPKGSDFMWHFPAYLTKDDSFRKLLRGWWLEYSLNAAQMSDPSLFWNATKAVMRVRIMAYETV